MRYERTTALALDPGTRQIGYAGFNGQTLLEHGVNSVRKAAGIAPLLSEVDRMTARLLAERRPDVLVVEKNNFSQARQNLRLALVIGRIRRVAKASRTLVVELDTRTIRKAVTGDGNATKRETARVLAVDHPELRVYLKSSQGWRVRYFMKLLDAVACGRAYHLLLAAGDRRVVPRMPSTHAAAAP